MKYGAKNVVINKNKLKKMNKKLILKKQIEQLAGIEAVELVCVEPETPDHAVFHVYFDPELVVDRLTPEEVSLRNYQATEKRGLINEKTTLWDFIDKIEEEKNELFHTCNNGEFDASELADISLVCDAMALHYGIDLQAEKEAKMKYNEKRKD